MAKKRTNPAPLQAAIDAAAAPAYLVDAERAITHANPALGEWVGLAMDEIVGRRVEYHSEEGAGGGLLTGLCPSPLAMSGEHTRGAISCVGRDGRLRRRRADFLPLPQAGADGSNCPVLVLVEPSDLGPNEPADPPTADATADRLHAALASQLRSEDSAGPPPCLLGPSPATAQLRRQADAAAASGANCMISGLHAIELTQLARWIHWRSAPSAKARLLPLDAGLLEIDQIEDRLEEANCAAAESPVTILLERIDEAPGATQKLIANKLAKSNRLRLLATAASIDGVSEPLSAIVSTIRLTVLPLAERRDDLPLVAQWCVEQANAGGGKQLAGLGPEAVELLAIYAWPGGTEELRHVIGDAHSRTSAALIEPGDLPAVVHQAALAAALPPRGAEAIVLDDLLGGIERELIERALAQAGDNKAEAARLLGMTRPRLYRRLARLGMLCEDEIADASEGPPK